MGYCHLWICGLVSASCVLHSFSALMPLFLILVARNWIFEPTMDLGISSGNHTLFFFFFCLFFLIFFIFVFFIFLFHFFHFFPFIFPNTLHVHQQGCTLQKDAHHSTCQPIRAIWLSAHQCWESITAKLDYPISLLVLRSVDTLRVSNTSNLSLWAFSSNTPCSMYFLAKHWTPLVKYLSSAAYFFKGLI